MNGKGFLRLGLLSLVWAQGNFGIGTTTPTERLDVEGGRLRVRAYSGTGTRLATVDPTGVFGTLAGNNPGEVLQWNGTAWVPATVTSGDNWGTQTAAVSAPLVGNGTTANPIGLQAGTAAGQVLTWNGTAWVAGTAPGDNWGTQTAVTSGPITGTGVAGNPITFSAGTAAGQVWQWNGANWVLATISGDNWGTQVAAVSAPLVGNGTTANPIGLQAGTAAGQVLTWNGTAWVAGTAPGDNWGTQTAVTSGPITGTGVTGNPITLQNGTAAGQVLLWTGAAWSLVVPTAQNGLTYTAAPTPTTELGGTLLRNTDIALAGFNLTFSGATGNVGIGTTTPTERLHVQGNLRLQGAFMPNNNAGTTGSLLLSAGAGTPPTWLAPGAIGNILVVGAGGTPTWAPNPICTTPTLNRFLKFTSTSPVTVCNTTLVENTSAQIFNSEAGAPLPGDKFSIYGAGANPWPINGYATIASASGIYGGNLAGGIGVWGEDGVGTGTGVVGVGNGATAANTLTGGSGGAFTGSTYALYSRVQNNAGDRAAAVLSVNGVGADWVVGAVITGTQYKIQGPGTASTLVSTPGGGFRDKVMFAPEAPEVLIMDFGMGQLQEGRAYVELDPIFSHNIIVNERHPLRVYIQLEDECEGVYVTNKSERGFEVRELRGGRSHARFSWYVVANRKDERDPTTGEIVSKYEGLRFPPAFKGPEARSIPSRLKEVKKPSQD